MSRSPDRLPETVSAMPEVSPHEIKREPNPFVDGDWRMLGYAWAGMLLRVLLIAGGIFSVVQYLQAREERRVERTLQLVDLWERADYQEAQRVLRDRLDGARVAAQSSLAADATPEEIAYVTEQIGITVLTVEEGTVPLAEVRDRFDRIVYFLNRVAFCVEGNLCSQDVADAYFHAYADAFWRYFSAQIARERRAGSPAYATPLERYVRLDR